MIEARTKIPLATTVVPIQEHETLSLRALVTQARTNLAGPTRLHQVVFDKGFLDGTDLWWLDQHGITCVVPAKAHMAVTADARAHTVRHGQGKAARITRLATEVVGITELTSYDQYGTAEHGRHATRRDFQAHPINAVVVRQWDGRDDGPGGKTVFLTKALVDTPLQPFDDDEERSLLETGWIKESTQQWSLKHPPQTTARAVRVHVLFTGLRFALGTAYRRQCEQADMGKEPVGWQRWRRQLLEETRDHVIVFAQDGYGIFHMAEYSRL